MIKKKIPLLSCKNTPFALQWDENGAFGEQDLSRGSKVHKFIVGKPVKG